jgi:hypothetical protein
MTSAVIAKNKSDWRWLGLPALGFFAAALVANNLWDRYVWFSLGLGMLAYVNTRPATAESSTQSSGSTRVRAHA